MAEGQDLANDGTVLGNLRGARYKKTHHPLPFKVISMGVVGNMVILGTLKSGCHVFSIHDDEVRVHCQLGDAMKEAARGSWSCHDVCADDSQIAFIKEDGNSHLLCLYKTKDVLRKSGDTYTTLKLHCRGPMVLDSDLGVAALGGIVWKRSWTSSDKDGNTEKDTESMECKVCILDLKTLKKKTEWNAVENGVSLLRQQSAPNQSLLGVGDSRAGIKVYDLQQPQDGAFVCLYDIPVEEVRSFQLVGNCVAVFHKFEANVSFWNMAEQRTVLCINIQDEMKKLAEEYLEEDEECDMAVFEEDNDHMTSVISLPYDITGHLLMYGTKSGCVFGINVETRSKVFVVPCPHELAEASVSRRDIVGIGFMHRGKIVGCYSGYGLTVMDFSPEDPPDRPPTRGNAK